MAKIGAEVPLTQLEVPEEDTRYCSVCGTVVGHREFVVGFCGFLRLVKDALAWCEKLYCGEHAPEEAKRHLAMVRGSR